MIAKANQVLEEHLEGAHLHHETQLQAASPNLGTIRCRCRVSSSCFHRYNYTLGKSVQGGRKRCSLTLCKLILSRTFLIAALVFHLMAITPIYLVFVGQLGYFCSYSFPTPIVNNASGSTLVRRSLHVFRGGILWSEECQVACVVGFYLHNHPSPIPGGSPRVGSVFLLGTVPSSRALQCFGFPP